MADSELTHNPLNGVTAAVWRRGDVVPVFLISRMREEWLRSGDAQVAVREGIAHTGGVVTAAARIMVMVFGSFVLFPDRMLQEMGVAMAVAVLLDALVIRCLAVPAAMRLLGDKAWWLPRWLERCLPRLHVDGPADPTPAQDPALAGHV